MRNHAMIFYENERDRSFLLEMAGRLGLVPCGPDRKLARLSIGRSDSLSSLLRLKERARAFPSVPLLVFVPPEALSVLGLLERPDCALVSEQEEEGELRRRMMRLVRARDDGPGTGGHTLPCLTERERQIVALLACGQDNRSIADRLGIRPSTVSAHKKNLFLKTGVHSTSQLVAWALVRELPVSD
jgi:DNA-binding CsgD family transcriptional regulator